MFDYEDETKTFSWVNDDCDNSVFEDESYCEDCQKACSSIYRAIIVNFLTLIPAVSGNLKRSTRAGDLNFTKFATIMSGTISTLSILVSLSLYQQDCYQNLPNELENGSNIDYKLGPGFICLLIPQILKPIEVLVNVLTPVVKDSDDDPNGLKEKLHATGGNDVL